MSAISIDDVDDVDFQADLARAIAASLEPDIPGPQEDAPCADTSGWNALIAAGQAATWVSSGLNAGRCTPALITAEDDDDEFQRQIVAAVAASIQSAEEERSRREMGTTGINYALNLSAHGALPMQGPLDAPPQGPAPQSIWRPPAPPLQQQQPQGVVTNKGSICCSSGLLLKPLAVARGPIKRITPQAPVSDSSCRAFRGTQRPCSLTDSTDMMQWSAGATLQTTVAPYRECAGEAVPTERAGPVSALGLSPAASHCSSGGDSAAPGEVPVGDVAASLSNTLPLQPEKEIASGGSGRGGLQVPPSSSPCKHARTPSFTGGMDSAQPQMKRSRPGSDIGAAGMSIPSQPLRCDALRSVAGWQLKLQPETVTINAVGWSDGGEGSCTGFDDKVLAANTTQPYSPPERPASAASCCAPSAGYGAYASEDGDGAALAVSGVASTEVPAPVAPQNAAWKQAVASGQDVASGRSPSLQQHPSPRHRVKAHALDGAELVGGRGQGPLSGPVLDALNLSNAVVPVSHGEGQGHTGSGGSDGHGQQQHQHAWRFRSSNGAGARYDLAPLDLSRPGLGVAQAARGSSPLIESCSPGSLLHCSLGRPPVAARPTGFVNEPASARDCSNSDAMVSESPRLLVPCGSYSGADRRMLLQQRVWWWLGPGQVQSGRISSIDRRSEPLLYSVRLDPIGDGTEGQTIIATADCLFPYLLHGDKLMCRLPPFVCKVVSMSGSRTGSGGGQTDSGAARRPQQLEEWPGHSTTEPGSEDLVETAMVAGPCAWMWGALQHCSFDGRAPMVHVLLGPEEVPYSVPYEFVVPVSDAAEGSGCASRLSPPAAVQ